MQHKHVQSHYFMYFDLMNYYHYHTFYVYFHYIFQFCSCLVGTLKEMDRVDISL